MAEFEDFLKLDLRVGTILTAEVNKNAKVPAYKLVIDFGSELGTKNSSAQLCTNYTVQDLLGKQIIAVVNFPSKRVAGFKSEVLVLAVVSDQKGTILIEPGRSVLNGDKIS